MTAYGPENSREKAADTDTAAVEAKDTFTEILLRPSSPLNESPAVWANGHVNNVSGRYSYTNSEILM